MNIFFSDYTIKKDLNSLSWYFKITIIESEALTIKIFTFSMHILYS